MIVDDHANVSDALHTATADANNGVSVGQNCACMTDISPDHVTRHEGTTTPPENILNQQKSKRKLTLSIPLRHTSVVKDRATVYTKSESTSCLESKIPNSSTEHLYDSIDACASAEDPVYHTLEPPKNTRQQDLPNKTAANPLSTLPPVPPKPKTGFAFRHRLETCATVSPTDFHRKKNPFADSQRRSVNDQLRCVMAIYEEVPTERKDSSISLPLRAAKQETQDNTEQKKEHVYHVLETLTPVPLEKNTPHVIPHTMREQQKQEETLKENKLSVTQTCSKVDEKILNVYQTKDEPGLPKVAKTPEENNYAEPFAPKRRLRDDKSHKCLFDDPSYCTQSHMVGHTSKRGNDLEESSVANQTAYDGPSYTTPVVRVKQIEDPSLNSESLFDDPKYNCAKVTTSNSKVKFDDPKYQLPLHTAQQLQKVPHKELSRHSSSVEDVCASVYSSTEEFLDASEQGVRGKSVDNLMDHGRSSIRHKIKRFDAKHRPNSVNMQHMKTTNV